MCLPIRIEQGLTGRILRVVVTGVTVRDYVLEALCGPWGRL